MKVQHDCTRLCVIRQNQNGGCMFTVFTLLASFVLVAAMNPYPCGYYGDPVKECTCSLSNVLRYQKRISGPLLDRIDIHEVPRVPRADYENLSGDRLGEKSETIRARVQRAHECQRFCFGGIGRMG